MEEFFGMKAFVYGEFSQKEKPVWANKFDTIKGEIHQDKNLVHGIIFLRRKNEINFKYAISFISIEQAEKNLNKEIPEWDFEEW